MKKEILFWSLIGLAAFIWMAAILGFTFEFSSNPLHIYFAFGSH